MKNFNIRSLFVLITIHLFILLNAKDKAPLPEIAIMVWDEKGKEGSDHASFQLVQIGEATERLRVNVKISGTAKEGLDYRPFATSMEIGKNGDIRIMPVQDGIIEGDETVTLTLLESPDYRIEKAHSHASVTIQDGELPDVQFSKSSSSNIESIGKAALKVFISEPFESSITVNYSIRGVIADEHTDYLLPSGTIELEPGKTETYIELGIINDEVPEDDETIIVRLTDAKNANIGLAESHYYTIKNDDGEMQRSIIHDRIAGALIGFRAGCAMGAPTELNFTQERLAEIHGLLDEFIPYVHYGDTWSHPAGATEDGGERHKLMCTAIIEKQDRITADDLLKIWLRDCELEDMYHMTQNYDRVLLQYAKWGVPGQDLPVTKYGTPRDLGEHIHLTARTFQAVPCINAGDPENAIMDMNDLGRLYYEDPNDDAFAWGAVYNAAMAIAMLPDATVESVIEDAMKYATPEIEKEIRHALAITEKYNDPMDSDMWKELTNMHADPESPYYAFDRIEKYRLSSIYENVTWAFALFKATRANVAQSVIIATNRGRDTDCTAASAGALAGALTGTSTIPGSWLEILESGIARNPYTNSHMTNQAIIDGIYRALQNKVRRMNEEVEKADAIPERKMSEQEAREKAYVELMRSCKVID